MSLIAALADYYARRCADPDPARRLAAAGWSDRRVAALIELTPDGDLATVIPTPGNDRRGTAFLLPAPMQRTGTKIAASLLCDTPEYATGTASDKGAERAVVALASFAATVESLDAQDDAGIKAVRAFLAADPAAMLATVPEWADITAGTGLVTYRLAGDVDPVALRPAVSAAINRAMQIETAPDGLCMVTGKPAKIARIHPPIKGVLGAQSSGAAIVSFNIQAAESHGLVQGANGPVGESIAMAYTTALNALLTRGSRQRMTVGGTTYVWWAQRADPVEDGLSHLFGVPFDDADNHAEAVRALAGSIRSGAYSGAAGGNLIHIAALDPSAARIIVSDYHACSLRDFGARIAQWFDDLELSDDPPDLLRVLLACAMGRKAANVPTGLAALIVRSILTGDSYPYRWLTALLLRVRAERNVSRMQAASLRAIATRNYRDDMTIQTTAPYLIGRLFARLEGAQSATGAVNASIRDKYFARLLTSPAQVIGPLMALNTHHMSKLRKTKPGLCVAIDKAISEIAAQIGDAPMRQSLRDQSLTALGYANERATMYAKAGADSE